jgi:GMP synthase (glutamine-hydrolysing)
VYAERAPLTDREVFLLGIPVLGICYGMQLMAHQLGGQVEFSALREYGPGMLRVTNGSQLFDGIGEQIDIWSSHGGKLTRLPTGFHSAARTENSDFAVIEDRERKLYGLQFHTARQRSSAEFRLSHLPLPDGLDDGLVHRRSL